MLIYVDTKYFEPTTKENFEYYLLEDKYLEKDSLHAIILAWSQTLTNKYGKPDQNETGTPISFSLSSHTDSNDTVILFPTTFAENTEKLAGAQ